MNKSLFLQSSDICDDSHLGMTPPPPRHSLMVSPGDFGDYSCHATNKLGTASAETPIAVEVSFHPPGYILT